jgi:ribonucleoside-diphosphate reductase alpha subunit
MHVIKRSGEREEVSFDKIAQRLRALSWNLEAIDFGLVVSHVACKLAEDMTTEGIDKLCADTLMGLEMEHTDYGTLAARVAVSNVHKKTNDSVFQTFERLKDVLSDEFFLILYSFKEADIQSIVDYQRDYALDFMGLRTFERLYCTKLNDEELVERPQHVYMRIALAVCGADGDLDRLKETYDLLSLKFYSHASPTMFNSGMKCQQLASCYLDAMDDSLNSIFDCFHRSASISKRGGGLGVDISTIRSRGSLIKGTNGKSDGVVPMLKVADAISSYVNQGGRRKGSMAVYIEVTHPDILNFLDLKRPGGDEESRCRNLFLAIWLSDLFMQRVVAGERWSLFDPATTPDLHESYGTAYVEKYEFYEREGMAVRTMEARDLWFAILKSQQESGVPYLLNKDACNIKSNQQNVGTIRSSNLCAEIVEYTKPGSEVAVCTLASISLPSFVKKNRFDFELLHKITKVVARNLDAIIDINHYPIEEARVSNMKHRPIGIGISGLADTFVKLKIPYDSAEAAEINERLVATMYHAAIEASTQLAEEKGSYSTFAGSPASKGQLQFDLWDKKQPPHVSLDWETLKARVATFGLRNSLSLALMPTATTASVLGNTESFEPIPSLYYMRRTLAGEYACIYKPLQTDLIKANLWSKQIRDAIIQNGGSIANIQEIPENLRSIYKTTWDIKQKVCIDMAAARGRYVCQSQSMNVYIAESSSTLTKLSSMHIYSWKKGLKTLCYYVRIKPVTRGAHVTLDKECQFCTA